MNQEVEVVETPVDTDAEVTVLHSTFGSYTFRCPLDEIAAHVEDHMQEAARLFDINKRIAQVDADQIALSERVKAAKIRVEAAEKLGDEDVIDREKAAVKALEAESVGFESRREALFRQK